MKLLSRLALSGLLLLAASPPAIGSRAVFRQIPLPTPNSGPTSVIGTAIGILFTEFDANKIGFLTRDGRLIEYPIPTPNSGPMDLDYWRDSDGNIEVWFTEFLANKIGRLNPHTGEFQEFSIPTPASGPHSIVASFSDVWFTEFNAGKIGRLTRDGQFTEFAIPTANSGPMGITFGFAPAEIWFTEFLGNKLGRMPLPGGPIEELPIPTPASGPTDIKLTGDSNLHFTEYNAGKVGHIDNRRTIVETELPTASSGPYRICRSPFRNDDVWFTERLGNRIGVIRRNGAVTEYELPAGHAEPFGCWNGAAETWFAQRTPSTLGWVHHDTSVVLGAGRVSGWETTFSYANAEPRPTALYAGFSREPTYLCGVCFWEGHAILPGWGTDSTDVDTSPSLVFSRNLDRGELPTLAARARYAPRPDRATDIPAVPLFTINRLDPQVLVFPGAMRSASARSNLSLANIWDNNSLSLWPDTSLSVRIDVFSSEGALLGSEASGVVDRDFVGYLDRLGIHELTNGQIRVTKTGGDALLWGSLTTVDGEAIVSDVGRNLSLPDPEAPGGDPLVVLGGVIGSWDTEFDVGNARAEPLNGTIAPLSCPGGDSCPGAPVVAFTVPPNGTSTLRASDFPGFPSGFSSYGFRFGGSGTAPTVRARVVNRARPSQTALVPALHLSAIRKLDGVLSFPGAAHSASGARSNLIISETGAGNAALLVEVFAPSGLLLKSIPFALARSQTAFLADVVSGAGGDVENGHVLVTPAGGPGNAWAILSTFDRHQALSVGWGIAP